MGRLRKTRFGGRTRGPGASLRGVEQFRGNACSGPHQVRGLDGSYRFQQRGNHELRDAHSLFTQLGVVSSRRGPQGSTVQLKSAGKDINKEAPGGSSPARCLQWSRTSCPVSAASATASAPATAGRAAPARRTATAGMATRVTAARPPAAPAVPAAAGRAPAAPLDALAPAGAGRHLDDHEHDEQHDHNPDESCHCAHRPFVPPKRAPRVFA